jgi:glycosyltransferase A (GT-A) superfamily protein (DUF2064 family)
VVAKAPVPGRCKTRLGATVGYDVAAEVAAASLLDTLTVCARAFSPERCVLALDGELAQAVSGAELLGATAGWTVVRQRGSGLGARLAHAHADSGPGPVVQVGMDTPQLTPALLTSLADRLDAHEAVLGPAPDGGWWALALRDGRAAAPLVRVPMSTPHTGAATVAALEASGVSVTLGPSLRDVDTASDAEAVAGDCPDGRFAAAWSRARGARP